MLYANFGECSLAEVRRAPVRRAKRMEDCSCHTKKVFGTVGKRLRGGAREVPPHRALSSS